ncbi:MAG: magnesium transporter CorA family protein [bacterium]|nr:magnesium transporter CorA family protein [bacterium]
MLNIQTVTHNGLRWVNVVKPTEEEMNYLRSNFRFHPLDLKDCLSPAQRPNLDKYPEYLFMILLFPVFDRKRREIKPAEVNLFVGKDYIVTVHQNTLPPLVDLFELCGVNDEAKDKYFQTAERLLYSLLNSLLMYCYPMLDHVSMDISNIDSGIFSGKEKKMVKEILMINRNITDFRRIMQTHKHVYKKLIDERNETHFRLNSMRAYFQELVEDAKDIWDTLQGYKESIETLRETNESLISFRINDIVKTLTLISVLALPVTVTASVFGMNARNMPFIGQPNDFVILLAICATAAISMFWYFKRKGMLQ